MHKPISSYPTPDVSIKQNGLIFQLDYIIN